MLCTLRNQKVSVFGNIFDLLPFEFVGWPKITFLYFLFGTFCVFSFIIFLFLIVFVFLIILVVIVILVHFE